MAAERHNPTQRPQRRPKRNLRGQAIVESIIALMVILLVFFALTQLVILASAQFIADHTAFVSARSHIVGFEAGVVQRAKEVGSIGLAGEVVDPPALSTLSTLELGAAEPTLIGEFIRTPGYLLEYERWPNVHLTLPANDTQTNVTFTVEVHDFPVDLPLREFFLNDSSIDLEGEAELFNHAAYYLD